MPTYPAGVRTFTPKHNVTDDVDAADINAAYDEITATQQTLGLNPQGAYNDVVTRLNYTDTALKRVRWGTTTTAYNATVGGFGINHGLGVSPTTVMITPVWTVSPYVTMLRSGQTDGTKFVVVAWDLSGNLIVNTSIIIGWVAATGSGLT